jgi:hypothetical protein
MILFNTIDHTSHVYGMDVSGRMHTINDQRSPLAGKSICCTAHNNPAPDSALLLETCHGNALAFSRRDPMT